MKFTYVRCSGCGAEVKWPLGTQTTPGAIVLVLCIECSKKATKKP